MSYLPFSLAKNLSNVENFPPDEPYETVVMPIGFTPWRADKEFIAFERLVDEYSMCGIGKLNFIWNMVAESAKLNDGIFMEVGSWRGGSGAIIAKRLKFMRRDNPVYLCDTFTGVVKAGDKDNRYVGGEHADTSIETVRELMKKHELDNVHILQGIFPEDTGDVLSDKKIAFVHIDVDVYQSGKDVFSFVWPRLINGGIIVFDDYGTPSTQGMKKFVDEIKDLPDRIFISNIMGQGVIIKK